MEPVDFGLYLKKKRKERKLTVRQLDLKSGVSHSYISQMENGARGIPSPEILQKLSGPLGVDYNELMKEAGYINGVEVKNTKTAEEISNEIMKLLNSNHALTVNDHVLTEDDRNTLRGMLDRMFPKKDEAP